MGMTLVDDGTEDPLPGRPRRSAYLVAVVVAMLLGGGTAFVLTAHGSPPPAHGAPAPTASPTDPGPALVAPADSPVPSLSPAASPSPVPHRTVTRTGPRPSATPTPTSPSPTPPAFYKVTKPVCGYVDFTPINALTKPAGKPDVTSNEQHFQGADNILFYCNGTSGNVTVKRINVMYYPNGVEAAAAYADIKSNAPEIIDQVSGIGTDAWGRYFDTNTYEVIGLANNITLQVIITLRPPGTNVADLRPAAITVARTMLPKLRVS
jgi:hypothetical protein